jgi:type II secretory pathway component GspD/PulD (secretin)
MRYVFTFLAALGWLAAGTSGLADEPRTGQVVTLELLIADAGRDAFGEGEVTAAKIKDLAHQAKLESTNRIQMSVLENAPGVLSFSETIPVATGRQDFGGRGGGTSYSMQNCGTVVQTTARVEQDGRIVLELQAERTRLVADRPAGEEAGAANTATKTIQSRVHTTTRLTSGQATIVGSQVAGIGKEAIHTYFVLTANVAEAERAAAAARPTAMLKVLALSHARAAEMVKTLRPILEGQRITIVADERSNSLIVHGAPEVLETATALVARLDEA